MDKEKLKSLKRIISTLPEEEAKKVVDLYESGQKTGYATLDMPWEEFYNKKGKSDNFVNTTPYQGLIFSNNGFDNEIALEYFGSKISFGELIKNINLVAKSLEEYGIKRGDFVTICSTTTPEVVYLFYAISKIGAIANVISPFYSSEELISRINECDSKLVIIVDTFFPKFKNILNNEKKKNIVVLPMMNSTLLKFISKKVKIDGKTNEVSWKNFVRDGILREDTKVDPYESSKPQAMDLL